MAYFFKLPTVNDLTIDQQLAVDEQSPIALSGGAGTGKSVVSLWRHIQNIETLNKSSILMTYTRTLQIYLFHSAKSASSQAYKKIHTVCGWLLPQNSYHADEIIIDEAQDLKLESLRKIKSFAKEVSYGADPNQQLYEGKVVINNDKNELKQLFHENKEYDLQQNFRNTFHILNFTKAVLVNLYVNHATLQELKQNNTGIKPKIFITPDSENEIDRIIEIIEEFQSETHNIAILLPFGASNYYTAEQSVEKYYDLLVERKIECSRYYSKLENSVGSIENVHITTFKSAKGLEFDTVIIPRFDEFRNNTHNAQSKVKDEDYYVVFTRAKRNLYLMSKDIPNSIDPSVYELEVGID